MIKAVPPSVKAPKSTAPITEEDPGAIGGNPVTEVGGSFPVLGEVAVEPEPSHPAVQTAAGPVRSEPEPASAQAPLRVAPASPDPRPWPAATPGPPRPETAPPQQLPPVVIERIDVVTAAPAAPRPDPLASLAARRYARSRHTGGS